MDTTAPDIEYYEGWDKGRTRTNKSRLGLPCVPQASDLISRREGAMSLWPTTSYPVSRTSHLKLKGSDAFLSLRSPLATTQGTTNLSNLPWKALVRVACAARYSLELEGSNKSTFVRVSLMISRDLA